MHISIKMLQQIDWLPAKPRPLSFCYWLGQIQFTILHVQNTLLISPHAIPNVWDLEKGGKFDLSFVRQYLLLYLRILADTFI